ncbi:integration host factor subunit beta [Spirochaetia bacterium]|nr:integration host factor subunit beta [Spirochaetia bacterium]
MADKRINKTELVELVSDKTNFEQHDVRIVLDCLLDEIKIALVDRTLIEIRGFGSFGVKIRKGREKARNPKTGAVVSVASHGVVFFRSGKMLQELVWDLNREDSVDKESSIPLGGTE